ncbi:MAG: helix-turn-helix domain-containing protein [Caldilinea sp.]|nr:helix-turn-helix domain-containing protein [Caldilinea sp.]MDW8441996.1 helix-turn-helix domain-containing protein [Caldilineaceae bacterium]
MSTFGELLKKYIERAGITDAELARSTGVQRQTIFRWKEGLTARPRYREDIVRIAAKLRLTPEERDELLLAAGFPPEHLKPSADALPVNIAAATSAIPAEQTVTSGGDTLPNDKTASTLAAETVVQSQRLIDHPGLMLGVAAALLLVIALIGTIVLRTLFPQTTDAQTASTTLTPAAALETPSPALSTPSPTPSPTPSVAPIVAGPGEHLIVIAPFVGYTSDDFRFNIAGRIREALEAELQQAGLTDVRIALWPEAIAEAEQAEQALKSSQAAMVIWGEYDAGRVRAGLTTATLEDAYWVNPVDAPSSLPYVINRDVPRDARVFALYTLAGYYRTVEETEKALAVYRRTLAQLPSDPTISASTHFYIALLTPIVQGYTVQSLTAAIYHYTKTLELQPTWENARYNRGTALLGRALLSLDERADLDAAITDFDAVIRRYPNRIDPLLNRGIAYYQRNDDQALNAAYNDFSGVIALAPEDYRGYYHRALVEIRRNGPSWAADLEKAQRLAPDFAPVLNALCWGYGTAGEAQTALPYCDAAVALDPTGASFDSRAIALAQLGRYEAAAADLRAYLAWVQQEHPSLYAKYRGPRVEGWIEALERGENPFTADELALLRRGAE